MCFRDGSKLKLRDLLSKSNLPLNELTATLSSLLSNKLLEQTGEGDTELFKFILYYWFYFSVNQAFSSEKKRIDIS